MTTPHLDGDEPARQTPVAPEALREVPGYNDLVLQVHSLAMRTRTRHAKEDGDVTAHYLALAALDLIGAVEVLLDDVSYRAEEWGAVSRKEAIRQAVEKHELAMTTMAQRDATVRELGRVNRVVAEIAQERAALELANTALAAELASVRERLLVNENAAAELIRQVQQARELAERTEAVYTRENRDLRAAVDRLALDELYHREYRLRLREELACAQRETWDAKRGSGVAELQQERESLRQELETAMGELTSLREDYAEAISNLGATAAQLREANSTRVEPFSHRGFTVHAEPQLGTMGMSVHVLFKHQVPGVQPCVYACSYPANTPVTLGVLIYEAERHMTRAHPEPSPDARGHE